MIRVYMPLKDGQVIDTSVMEGLLLNDCVVSPITTKGTSSYKESNRNGNILRAIEQTYENEEEYLLLMDSDVVLCDGIIQELLTESNNFNLDLRTLATTKGTHGVIFARKEMLHKFELYLQTLDYEKDDHSHCTICRFLNTNQNIMLHNKQVVETDSNRYEANESITILMANYNNSKYVKEAIESVKDQDCSNWKLFICDDCSTDNSVSVIEQASKGHESIVLIENRVNEGYIAVLKRLIAEADTDIIAILDSDDALEPDAVRRTLIEYESDSDIGLVTSEFTFYESDFTGPGQVESNLISHLKSFRKTVYDRTEGLDPSMKYAEDRDLLYKLQEVTKSGFVGKPIYKYRLTPDSASHSIETEKERMDNHRRAITIAKRRRETNGLIGLPFDYRKVG